MPGRFELVMNRMPKWGPAADRGLWALSDSGWATQANMQKKFCYGRGRTWGVNIAVRPCLQSFLTDNKHHLFENKVWEIYIFIKKCIHSLLKSSLTVDYDPVYICTRAVVCGYATRKLVHYKRIWGCPRGVMVKAMDCGIVIREFVFQSRYYVHFRANTLGKGMNPLILPAMG